MATEPVHSDPFSELGQEMKEVNLNGNKDNSSKDLISDNRNKSEMPFATSSSSAATVAVPHRKKHRGKKHAAEKLEKPQWVPDEQATKCHKCESNFSLFVRKHHCRGCGNIFCIKCCDNWLLPPKELEYTTVQRTCQDCFKRLSSIDFDRTYDQWGNKGDPAIILIHGSCGTRKHWFLLGPALAEKGYHVLAPDMPEHGARYQETLYMNSAIEAVADMIHYYVPAKKAVLCGYSMGGYIAMAFGAKYPELCRGLIIGGAGTDVKKDRSSLEWKGTLYKMLSNKRKTKLEEDLHNTPLIAAQVEADVLNEYCLRPGSYYDAWPHIVTMLTGENYKKLLMQIKLPVLFFTGQYDGRDAERKWLNATSNARLEVIADATYMCLVDQRHRDKVKDLVLQFANYAIALSKDKRQDRQGGSSRSSKPGHTAAAVSTKGKEKKEPTSASSSGESEAVTSKTTKMEEEAKEGHTQSDEMQSITVENGVSS